MAGRVELLKKKIFLGNLLRLYVDTKYPIFHVKKVGGPLFSLFRQKCVKNNFSKLTYGNDVIALDFNKVYCRCLHKYKSNFASNNEKLFLSHQLCDVVLF